jgi:hypothetical protein
MGNVGVPVENTLLTVFIFLLPMGTRQSSIEPDRQPFANKFILFRLGGFV